MNSGITDLTHLANLALTDLGTLDKDLLSDWETDDTELARRVRMLMPLSILAVQSQFRWRSLAAMSNVEPRAYLDYVTATVSGQEARLAWSQTASRYENASDYVEYDPVNGNYLVEVGGISTFTTADDLGYPSPGPCDDDSVSLAQELVSVANTMGYSYRCDPPDDFLEPYIDNETPCVLEGGYLYSSSPGFPYRYVRQSLDPNEWEPQMASVIRARVALDLYVPANDDEQAQSKYLSVYNQLVKPLAERVDSYGTNVPSKSYRRSTEYSKTRSGGIAWRR